MHDDHNDAGPGRNGPFATIAQWQTPHLTKESKVQGDEPAVPDADVVEESFVEGFRTASDASGKTLRLLRVHLDQTTDVGAVTPHLGGRSYRYDPLPARLVSKRQRLRFVYHDGEALVELGFTKARGLEPAAEPRTTGR